MYKWIFREIEFKKLICIDRKGFEYYEGANVECSFSVEMFKDWEKYEARVKPTMVFEWNGLHGDERWLK